jgi:hypothetical protein
LFVSEELDFFECGDASGEELVKDFEEGVDLSLAIEDLNDDGEVLGGAEQLCGIKPGCGAIAHIAAEDGGAGQAGLLGLDHDLLIEGPALIFIVLAQKDPEPKSGFELAHWASLSRPAGRILLWASRIRRSRFGLKINAGGLKL